MDEKIKKAMETALHPDEKVVWESGTMPFKILDGREGKQTLLQWVLSAVCILGLLGVIAAYGNFTATVVGLLIILLALLLVSPVLSYRATQGQRYYITNERALLAKPDGTVYAIDRDDVDGCKLMKLQPHGVALVVGSTLYDEGDRQLRWRAFHPKLGHTAKSYEGLTQAEGLVFYNIERADEAARLLGA